MEWGDYYMNEEDYAMQVGMGAGFRVRSFFLFFSFFVAFCRAYRRKRIDDICCDFM